MEHQEIVNGSHAMEQSGSDLQTVSIFCNVLSETVSRRSESTSSISSTAEKRRMSVWGSIKLAYKTAYGGLVGHNFNLTSKS